MRLQTLTLLFCFASAALPAYSKQKDPVLLPPWLLSARTVAVLIDPEAGVSLRDPNANQVAQRDVEAALANWGRFQLVPSGADADLLIVVRRGDGHFAEPTVADPRQNRRPGSITPTDSGVSVGAQQGTPPFDPAGPDTGPARPRMKTEIGHTEDLLAVYRGTGSGDNPQPLDNPPAWRVLGKDALKPHSVPAVEQFREAVAAAEKAAAQPSHP